MLGQDLMNYQAQYIDQHKSKSKAITIARWLDLLASLAQPAEPGDEKIKI